MRDRENDDFPVDRRVDDAVGSPQTDGAFTPQRANEVLSHVWFVVDTPDDPGGFGRQHRWQVVEVFLGTPS